MYLMWRRASSSCIRRFFTAVQCQYPLYPLYEGDWPYMSEWCGTSDKGQTVFLSTSGKGNGVVSVHAHLSSRPLLWAKTERWLQRRYEEVNPGDGGNLKLLGNHWRVLRFNDVFCQSTAKVMSFYHKNNPDSVYLMQQPNCLALPNERSMVSAGLTTLASCNYDIISTMQGKKNMHILCIGHRGGSIPLFLASKIQGAIVHIVENDPLVISASIQAMGFPAFSFMTQSGDRASAKPDAINEVMWRGIHERLYLYEADAEEFINNNTNLYDMIFIDDYDGKGIFPHKLRDPDSPFLKALGSRLHPKHGTVVVNLFSDSVVWKHYGSVLSVVEKQILPTEKYMSQVCRAYKDVLVGTGGSCEDKADSGSGLAFTVAIPWVRNTTLVVCRGFVADSEYINPDSVEKTLISKSLELEYDMDLPFSFLEYVIEDFVLVE